MYVCMYVWRIVHRWLNVLILLVVVLVAGSRLADGLQRERLVGARCRRSERTLPGELHAASGLRSLLSWQNPDRSRGQSHRVHQTLETTSASEQETGGFLHSMKLKLFIGKLVMFPTYQKIVTHDVIVWSTFPWTRDLILLLFVNTPLKSRKQTKKKI